MNKLCMLLTFCLWCVMSYAGQADPQVKGRLIDAESGAAIDFADVFLFRTGETQPVKQTFPDKSGVFGFTDVSDGNYTLMVRLVGYDIYASQPLQITAQARINLGEVRLKPLETGLAEVEVVAEKRQLVYKLDKKVVEASSNMMGSGGSAVDILENTPSIRVDAEGEVTFRGSSGFLVYIDGKPSIFTGTQALEQVPAGQIENIEIITTPSAKHDTEGDVGIINIITKKHFLKGLSGMVNLSGSTWLTRRGDFLLNQQNNRSHWFIGGQWSDKLTRSHSEKQSTTLYGVDSFSWDADGSSVGNRFNHSLKAGWGLDLDKTDVLLLDEPTNHLDIESIQWLEDFLIESGQAVVVISHDRAFVDHITTRTIEVTMGRIYDYKVNYSQYLQLRKERREQQQKAYDEQQKFIAETKEFIERFKGTYSKTLQVQSRVKMLEKLELLEVDEEDTSALRLKFPPSPRSGSYPVIIEDVSKSYGDKTVFRHANLTIERGDKIAFVGRNGEGKSTLVKCIMKEIEHEGKLTIGHNVMIGYFAQNQASLLDENLTVFQTIDDVAKGDIRNKIKDLLGAFMFGGENSAKKVKVLSGGERTRLAMIKLLLEPVNLLILDEPTNHLDMKTKDILKQALLDFDGTLIVVSHDRDFLDGLVTKVYEFGHQRVTEHLEGIYEFMQRKKMENLRELERKN